MKTDSVSSILAGVEALQGAALLFPQSQQPGRSLGRSVELATRSIVVGVVAVGLAGPIGGLATSEACPPLPVERGLSADIANVTSIAFDYEPPLVARGRINATAKRGHLPDPEWNY